MTALIATEQAAVFGGSAFLGKPVTTQVVVTAIDHRLRRAQELGQRPSTTN